MFRIVLIEPEIPQNTGNIARLAAATGLELLLVGKLGFSIDDKHLKRAGMDYWQHANVTRIATIEEYLGSAGDWAGISTKGAKCYTDIVTDMKGDFDIVFGAESCGLPKYFYEKYPEKLYRIPMREGLRSLNLSSSAAIVAYDIISRGGFKGLV